MAEQSAAPDRLHLHSPRSFINPLPAAGEIVIHRGAWCRWSQKVIMRLMDYRFEAKQFADLTRLEYKISLTQSRRVSYANIMLVQFIGEYGYGSAGDSDAQFMVAMLKAAVWAWEPSACIVDLSELKYEWGNGMDVVLGFADDVLQVQPVTVVGPNCSRAIGTLLPGLKYIEDFAANFVVKSRDEAFAQIERQLFEANLAL